MRNFDSPVQNKEPNPQLQIDELQTLDNTSNADKNSQNFDQLSKKKTHLSQFKQQQNKDQGSIKDDSQQNILNPGKKVPLNQPAWKISWQHKFIQFWQTIFNRRIISFSCFALQIGDIVIFSVICALLAIVCVDMTDTASSGDMASILMAATIVFGCRNGLLSYLFGLSLERAILWHQFLAWITLGMSLNHWFNSDSIFTGFLVEVPLIGLLAFSIKPVRRYLWEFFMKVHWIMIIVLTVGCVAHGATISLFGIGYFALDLGYRLYTVCKHKNMSQHMNLEKVGSNITKISMKKENSNYKGGQYFFLMIPKISYFQWHPFSVFSASYEDEIVIYVKSLGDWTSELYKIAGDQGKPTEVKGYVDGPYGYHSISIEGDKYKNFLCISGGIGVTPIISTAKEILHQMEKGRPISNLHFIWTGRDSAIVQSVVKPGDLKNLITQDDKNILKTFYHYSDKGDKKIDQLQSETQNYQEKMVQLDQGRPDFNKYFEAAFQAAKQSGHKLVGVLTCGPQQLIDTVEINSMKWSKEGIRFDCHQEVFNF
ncbi:hypothetical protein ABPG74_002097 [Tetrahymena malaccensis]